MENSKGIVIIATGHSYYGRMAFNLIASILSIEKFPIALIHDDTALHSVLGYDLLNEVQLLPYTGKEHALRLKTRLYDLSPFDETLFLDADTLWLKKRPSELFAEFKDIDLTIANHGYTDLETLKKLPGMNDRNSMYWAEPKELKEAYQFHKGKYYSLSTEVIWFKRSDEVKSYFEWVKDIWDAPLIQPRKFAGVMPDEFAFSVAAILQERYPHKDLWRPSFWAYVNPRNSYVDTEIWNNYYIYSAGGKLATDRMRRFYDNHVKAIFNRMGLKHPFELKNKLKYIPERETT